jgi:hypothetical protein
VDLELFDDVTDMPLDGVWCDAQTLSHHGGIEPFGEQVQDLELSWSELRPQLLVLNRLDVHPMLARYRFGEQRDGYKHLAAGGVAHSVNDLIGRCSLCEVSDGAGVDRIQQV